MALLQIAGVEAPPPTDIRVTRTDILRQTRAASGRLVADVIRQGVRRLEVSWRWMAGPDLQALLDLLEANAPFFQVVYEDADESGSMVASVDGEIGYGMAHRLRGVRYWSEITVSLMEQ